ncbi:MAG: (2Fe-2S) ferredoxin domain-containing protein [Planctomycetes bacterium]|nr:(2Fe-2S) ferredoxin domain-containing protein [Planctomycetota bacterium]
MPVESPSYLMICTGPNCGERGGRTLVRGLRDLLIERGQHGPTRVAPVSCFGQCATGPYGCAWPNGAFVTGLDASRPEVALAALSAQPAPANPADPA